MSSADRKLWPFKPRLSILIALVLLIVLLILSAVLKATLDWPSDKSETPILVGTILFSSLPVLLALVDVLIERGAVIEYAGVKVDFSRMSDDTRSDFTVPANIGLEGTVVPDSGTNKILDALMKATAHDLVIIDLEEGQAWWETRLLVLIAGAVRLGSPEKIVFIGTEGGKKRCFQGWAYAKGLLPLLLQAHKKYPLSYHKSQAAALQWQLVEPSSDPAISRVHPFVHQGLAGQYAWIAFDDKTGLPNPLLAEQLLAAELETEIEKQEPPVRINISRLEELFRPVLCNDSIDESMEAETQMNVFFGNDNDYIPLVRNRYYTALVSRQSIVNVMLKTVIEQKK